MIRCYITDRRRLPSEKALCGAIERAIAGGADWIQIREKDLPARDLLALVRRVKALARPDMKILVNGRMDVALAAGADGLHLAAGSIAPSTWRWMAPGGFLIGVSCHTVAEVKLAADEGADYVFFGPVFAPISKMSELAPRGIEGLAEAATAVEIPVMALGGITHENAQRCMAAGAKGIAGISLFQGD
jgi:thiamine-phosphate pyrophosphorylase